MGDAVSTALSGTTSVFRNLYPKRTFSLAYGFMDAASADLLLAFYQGLFGIGPFIYVDASARNMLAFDVSACGRRTVASPGWVASTGTLAGGTTGGPTQVPTSGVLTWTTPTASATLQPGLNANTADVLTAPPNLTTEAVTVSLWVKCASSKSVTLQLVGYDSAGAVVNATLTSTATVGTTWTQMTVSAAAGVGALSSSVFVLPRLVVGASAPTSIQIAGAQLEYGSAATSWQPGFGAPRVVITGSPGRDLPLVGRSDHTLTLAE